MKFDTIIIGGGLAGLVCGIKLQKAGQKCAIIAAGQNAMHFSSGYFDMLDRTADNKDIASPFDAIQTLAEDHPYSKIGKECLAGYAGMIKEFFASCGITLNGDPMKNGYRISPTGDFKTTWLGLPDFEVLSSATELPGKKILMANIEGYLDFNTSFIAESLEDKGAECKIIPIKLEEMERLRKNPSEMRATNIARVLEQKEVLEKVISYIKGAMNGEDAIILPAIFGLKNPQAGNYIQQNLGVKVFMIATMPPSVPGIRTQMRLKTEFENLGGMFLQGDTACRPEMDNNSVKSIGTTNFDDIRLVADNFVLATGSFFSKGLNATPEHISETVFGLDVDAAENREEWSDQNFFNKQNYISFGVHTDNDFKCFKNREKIQNLYAIGSILSGCNSLLEGSGAGVAIFSAFKTADTILSSGK